MDQPHFLRLRRLALAIGSLAFASACAPELQTERTPPPRRTVGFEVWKVLCERLAAEAWPRDVEGRRADAVCTPDSRPDASQPPRLRTLLAERERFVLAVDATLPEASLDPFERFLADLLPFYDPPEERFPEQARALGRLLEQLAAEPQVPEALARIGYRQGYRPLRLSLGIVRPALAYPGFDELSERALAALDEGGSAREPWLAALRSMALEMADARPSERAPGERSGLQTLRDLLLRTDDAFARGGPVFLPERDERGLARVRLISAPFVDRDADGLADVDALGRFVDAAGQPFVAPPPFAVVRDSWPMRDPVGRALAGDGRPLYDYLDVNPTFGAAMLRESRALLDPEAPALLDLAAGLPALLGPETRARRSFGRYVLEYDLRDPDLSPLVDLTYTAGVLLPSQELADVLTVTERLLTEHEEAVAALIDGLLHVGDVADRYPDAKLEPRSELLDDLLEVATWMAQEPGLLASVMRAMGDPRVARLGAIYAEMIRHRDVVGYNPANPNQPRREVDFREPVDWAAPNTKANHSVFQRTLAIIHDLSGVRFCNKEGARIVVAGIPTLGPYRRCELFEMEDVAREYALSIAGRGRIEFKPRLLTALIDAGDALGIDTDEVLAYLTGIDGFGQNPTPEALSRLVYAPRNDFLSEIIDDPPTRDGVPVATRHDTSVVFTWEREYVFCGETVVTHAELRRGVCNPSEAQRVTFFEAMAPLIAAFDDRDRRTEGRFLFNELISRLHLHWPTPEDDTSQSSDPAAPYFTWKDGAARYEPILYEALAECTERSGARCSRRGAALVRRFSRLVRILDEMEVRPGVDGIDALAAFAERSVDPARNPGLTDRRGNPRTVTAAGRRRPLLTPVYLLLDAARAMDDAFAADEPGRREAWERARRTLVDRLLQIECTSTTSCRFQSRRGLAVARHLVAFAQELLERHRTAGDLDAWAASLDDDLADTLRRPTVNSLARLADELQRDPAVRSELGAFLQYLVDEERNAEAFQATAMAAVDLLQVLDDDEAVVPLLHGLSEAFALDARRAVREGVEPDVTGALVDRSVRLAHAIGQQDEEKVLPGVLARLVEPLDALQGQTPLEAIVEVVQEVHRADPGAGTVLEAEDYRVLLERAAEAVLDEHLGLERMFQVVQHRRLDP